MKALQLHYTSCRRGQSGSPGFQVRAVSPGIRPDEQREIERRGVYRPPRGAPAEPTSEQIAGDLPRAFRSYALESGRRALTLSCYTGKDYSGRWGNFFAHTLVLDGEADPAPWPGRWPIDYYEWEGWRQGFGPAENEPDAPPALPSVELGQAPPAESFELGELQRFLTEEPGRRELLARMGRAVMLGRESSRPLVLRADALDGAYWVACILKLFPPRHAWELTFSTYQDDPRGAAVINATVQGTDFTFSEAERSYQFYMFDPAAGIASEVPRNDADYPSLAACWLAEEPETLEAFFGSLHRFEPFPLDTGELWAAAQLFRAGRGEISELDGRRLAELLDFAGRRASAQGRVALMTEIGEVLLRSADPGELAGDGSALRFLAEVANATGQPPHRRLAFTVWLRWLERSLAAGGTGLEALGRGWSDLREVLGDYRIELAAELLDPDQLGRCRAHYRALGPQPLAWLLGRVHEALKIAGRNPFWRQPETRELVAALLAAGEVEPAAVLALGEAHDDAEALAGLSLEIFRAGSRGSPEEIRRQVEIPLGRALGKVLCSEPAAVARKTRQALETCERWSMLWGEWLFLLAEAGDPTAAFAAYDREVLEALPRYRERARGRVLETFLDRLGEERASAQAARWVASGEADSFSRELQQRCTALANRQVSLDLDDPVAERLAVRVEEKARKTRQRLQPNTPWLRWLLRETRDTGSTSQGIRGNDLKAALEGIDAVSYRCFLEGFLLQSLEEAGTYNQHRDCLLAVFQEPLQDILAEVYSDFFYRKRTVRDLPPLQAGIKLWLLFDPSKKATSPLAPLESETLQVIAEGLRRLPAKSFRELQSRLDRARLREPALRRWRQIEDHVRSRSKGFFRQMFGGLGRFGGSGDRDRSR